MALKAVNPQVVPVGKPKFLFSGPSGAGKTLFSLNFPRPYLIDTEGGATRPEYKKRLQEVGGAYFGKEQGSQDFEAINHEVRELATTKHEYRTLVIDSFSMLYLYEASIAEEKVGSDFGRDKKEANRPTRELMRWIDKIDMSVILICHQRDKWKRHGKELVNEGSTFDGYEKLEYMLDLWIELEGRGHNRGFRVKKTRISTFPEGEFFPLDYVKFEELYGTSIINRESKPLVLASAAQVKQILHLLDTVKVSNEEVVGWFRKADVSSWEEMPADMASKVIAYLEKKLEVVR